MGLALLVDIGSTYTKAIVVDLESLTVLGRANSLTTVNEDIMLGIEDILLQLKEQEIVVEEIKHRLACSSAAGGLKLIASGLVPDLTAEAAKRAALGAGAKVSGVYSYELTNAELEEIINLEPDIMLLAGGTDGGNSDLIIENATRIAKTELDIPIIIAGNKAAADKVKYILHSAGKDCYITENVMPELESLNIGPARDLIRQIFLEEIIYAKGFTKVEDYFGQIILPTPAAVMQATNLLAKGAGDQSGLGELMVVDIGGATTDIHSAAKGNPTRAKVSLKGLEEPFLKRTVEGDLGMRYGAPSLLEVAGEDNILGYSDKFNSSDLAEYLLKIKKQVNYLPGDDEIEIEAALAKAAIRLAIKRHVGKIEVYHTPWGEDYIQRGKDLTGLKLVIATGGVLVHHSQSKEIIKQSLSTLEKQMMILAPKEPKILIDNGYLLSALGLLAEIDAEKALKFAKKYLKSQRGG